MHDWTWIDQTLTGVIRQRNRLAFSIKKETILINLKPKEKFIDFHQLLFNSYQLFKQNGHLSKWKEINLNKPAKFPQWNPSLSPNCNNKISMTVLALSCIGVNCVQFVTKGVKTFPLCQRRTTKITQIQFMFLSRLLQEWVNCSRLEKLRFLRISV